MANFLSDARAALRVVRRRARRRRRGRRRGGLDREGLEAAAENSRLPRLVVLNRLDRERASLDRSLESLRAVFGRTVVPMQLPIGEEKTFRGVVDLVAMKAWTFADGRQRKADRGRDSGRSRGRGAGGARGAHRDGRRGRRHADGEVLRRRHADAGGAAVGAQARHQPPGACFPVLCASATANIGMQPLLDAHRRLRAVARRAAVSKPGRTSRTTRSASRRRDDGPGGGVRLEDRRRSVRRTHHDVPRGLRRV